MLMLLDRRLRLVVLDQSEGVEMDVGCVLLAWLDGRPNR